MLKYIVLFGFFFGMAVYVAIQDEHATQQSAQEAEKHSNLAIPAKPDANHPQQNIPNAERNLPSWFGFFRWPNGTTTWAIVLTLLAIAEQTRHTARAANIANQTLISTLRPRLIVRGVHIDKGTVMPVVNVTPNPWKICFDVANTGGTIANIKTHGFNVRRFEHDLPPRLPQIEQIIKKPFSLEAGASKPLSIDINEGLAFYFRLLDENGLREGYQDMDKLYFWGFIKYSDDLGTMRNVGVLRHYENKTGKFKAVADPDYEYAD